jgi:ATP-dependent DNA helicase RecG
MPKVATATMGVGKNRHRSDWRLVHAKGQTSPPTHEPRASMLTEPQLLALMSDLESFRVERTISTTDTDKSRETICSFANDMPGSRLPGYLLVGVDDKTGQASGLTVTDKLLQQLTSYGSDGTILPPPALVACKHPLASGAGDVAVVEVQPSHQPPVRYKGRICVRNGPRKGVANEAQERILIERRTAASKPFDSQPCMGSTLDDLALDLFLNTYRVQAIAREVLEENNRPVEQQLASLRLFDLAKNCPTYAAILLFAKDPLRRLSHAYVHFLRFPGATMDGDPEEKRFTGDLLNLLRELDAFVRTLPTARPVAVSALREENVYDYSPIAIRELLMNAVAHRSYEAASPIRFYQFSDRLEIINPGPLYGEATPANFPRQTSYRNPVVAEALAILGFVNQYGRGVLRAQEALKKNGSPEARFEFGDTFFGVTIPVHP